MFYMILFAAAIGVATFIENDFGTSAAQKVIFKAHWFEALLILFGISLIENIRRFRLVQQKKWAILTFHLAMIVILIGSGVTRYFGYEGMMGIREGSASNSFLSAETYLQFQVANNGKRFSFDEPVLFASLGNNHFKRSYIVGQQPLDVELLEFVPNPVEELVDDPAGKPTLKIVIGGAGGREEYLVSQGDKKEIHGTLFNFGGPEDPAAFNIKYENKNLTFIAGTPYAQMVMATQTRDTLAPGMYHPLMLRSLYSNGVQNFVFGDFKPQAGTQLSSTGRKMMSTSEGGLRIRVKYGQDEKELFVTGTQGREGLPVVADFGQSALAIAYGSKRRVLPFSIQLRDFIMERYPGTDNASSYASEVTLVDTRANVQRNQRIFMNNILDYDGYRFFQSSYDQDELGTYLSVNYDAPGTWISYLGYILLTLGMVLTLFSKKSRFSQLAENIKGLRATSKSAFSIAFLLFSAQLLWAGPPMPENPPISASHAKLFGEVLMQDHKGRLKPLNTFSSEVLRKISRKESLFGQSAEQIVLGMAANPEAWYDAEIIKLGKHEEVRNLLHTQANMVSYNTFFDEKGDYILKDVVRNAYNVPPRDRGVFEKELIKLDEKVNICALIFSGRFMKVFPVPGDTSQTWASVSDVPHNHDMQGGGSIIEMFYPIYIPSLNKALKDGDWSVCDKIIGELQLYQQKYGGEILPSESKINAELLLNKMDIFNRLTGYYGLLGLAYLVLLFTSVFKPNLKLDKAVKVVNILFWSAFALHTLGLGLRWYVSGRAPWSNGYESMIYIGWTTVLAGVIFARKSLGALAATNVLAATIMMVAGLSWLDPEITPLVPVLKSYWLTIHVSLEAGSYGFLVLGAIIGVLNLIFMIVASEKNKDNIYRIIRELSWISEMTLIGGLFMLSIGTYLGGVWANESWGRYWGWDAKETWALVTILVYSFILHMRFVPGLRGLYAFNVATLFGWASVAMTYFGVNYYLSGLHSYAAGDPVPVPDFVYYIVAGLVVISLIAKWKHKKLT
ncbi:MAG: cytochrome c biogenesis protein CcsA [Saprospiraceae bacterium]|nr:cytochrome c biogenesis protein CcsA [Saprospiraceae bacterium]